MKPKMPNIHNYIDKEHLILPNEFSHVGLDVPEIIFKYGSAAGKLKDMPFMLPKLVRCLVEAKKSYSSLTVDKSNLKTIDKITLDKLSEYAKSLGVDHIGFTQVPRHLIFDNKGILYPNAMVITMEMTKDRIELAPSVKTTQEIFRTYMSLGIIVNQLTEFLRKLGYNAQAGPALGGDVNYPMLAQKAGLGQVGKHGLLITPDFGPSLRIAAVYTDIENLPYTDSNEHQWINEFCENCNQCVKNCPAEAIYQNSIVLKDQSKVCVDYKKCAIPFSNDHGCTVCVKHCLFFRSDYKKIKESYGSI